MQPSNKKKQQVSVRDKLDGNEIDLSLLELSEVPVKELVTTSLTLLSHHSLFDELIFSPTGCCTKRHTIGPVEQ